MDHGTSTGQSEQTEPSEETHGGGPEPRPPTECAVWPSPRTATNWKP